MSTENKSDSSSSDSDMEQDSQQQYKFRGFKGEGEDLLPVRYLLLFIFFRYAV
jgi:hypothetical protein